MKPCGIIILAAGDSSRLGHAKQLLTFKNKSLLKHVLDEAECIKDAQVILVLGAKKEQLQKEIAGSKAIVCYNEQWEQGMSSSIHLGIQTLLQTQPDVSCCIISVCDQPFLNAAIFQSLVDKFNSGSCDIVASSYANTAGTPVLFSKAYFPALLELKGQEGAKKLLKTFKNKLDFVPFEKGEIDIDTANDYKNLLANF